MRDDQYIKLQSLSEKLTDTLFDEIDPDVWPAAGKKPAELTKDERGDRYWSKKNAAATLTLITKVGSLINLAQSRNPAAGASGETADPEVDIDKEIAAAEKEAAARMDELAKQREKREFLKRAVGNGSA